MGKRKIKIERISNNRQRQVSFLLFNLTYYYSQLTFYKRKNGLIKKAMELSMLCSTKVILSIVENGKTVTYSSEENPMEIVQNFTLPQIKRGEFITSKNVSEVIYVLVC